MFTCDENIYLAVSNEKHVELALKDTYFQPSNDFQTGKINDLISLSSNNSRVEIIDFLIQAVADSERYNKEPLPFIKLFYYLSEKFGYRYTLDSENTNLMTCYKYSSAGNFDKISVPVSRIKYIIQHNRSILGANTSIDTLSLSRVSCITESEEEFRIHPGTELMICLKSDEVYKSAVRHLNNAIQTNRLL
ncbi:hypothetical protein ACSFCW_26990 [Yokenella regensburgei]|uniref:hypothetical protein n=1 Tax=Yokenella regensburgei TaxID=158877 RepID=UPI003ED99838